MEKLMKVFQFILLGLVLLINPLISSIGLLGLSFFFFQKHDWEKGFFGDRWGAFGGVSFLIGVIVYVVLVYIPSQA